MRRLDNKLFLLVVAFQVVILLLLVAIPGSIILRGNDVLLKIEPVDPRDPLRGDYVTFRYEISEPDIYYSGEDLYREGQIVYVSLYESRNYWRANDVSLKAPSGNQTFIKGRITRVSGELPYRQKITIIYGVEEYFIPENSGRDISFWNSEVVARVALGSDGTPVLKQLYVDGKEWP